MADVERADQGALSRRRILQAGAIGSAVAGAAWVTPSVLTMDAASAASCSCSTPAGVNWSNSGTNRPASLFGPPTLAGYPFTWGSFGGVSVEFRLSGTALVFDGSSDLTGRQRNTQNGGVTGIYGIDRQGAAANTDALLSIRFSCNVRNLRFTILDIDRATSGGNNYIDRVTVRPFLNSGPISGTYTPVSGTPSFAPTTASTGTVSSTYTGTTTTGASSNAGNLAVVVNGPVDRIDITYGAGHTGTGTLQEVALSNLTWTC